MSRRIKSALALLAGRVWPAWGYTRWYWSRPDHARARQLARDSRPDLIVANDVSRSDRPRQL